MKRSVLPLLLLGITVVAAGCGSSGRPDDFAGNDGRTGSGSGGSGGSGDDGCSAASKLVYVVDQNNKLSQFDPTTKMFTDLGTLSCHVDDGGGLYNFEPFSMGVDRNATAYVLYVDQNGFAPGPLIFKVDTQTSGLPCTATSFTSPSDLSEFGMGFSTTTAGGDTDQLFIAGGTDVGTATSANVKTLDVTSYTTTSVGTVPGSPELTGNANAELWGFFPDATNPRIEQLNKTGNTNTGGANLPASMKGMPMAWAFAFYGGDYYIFLMKGSETSTTVYQVDQTGALMGTTPTNSRVIVGAGVSTCAPVVIE